MQVKLYTDLSEIPLTPSDWNQLVADNHTGSVFLQYHWITIWWKHFGSDYKLRFFTAEDNSRVVAFAPLMLDIRGQIRFIGDTNADYLDFVIPVNHEQIFSAFIEQLQKRNNEWTSVVLKNMPGSSPFLDLMSKICGKNRRIICRKHSIEAPSLVVKGHEKDIRNLFNRYSIRRAEKQLRKYGELKFVVIRNATEAESLWTEYFTQHVERCDYASRDSSFQNPKFRQFVIDLFNADPEGQFTHFSALFSDNTAAAFHFGFISENRLLWYKPCFDINVKKGSPGTLLIRYLSEYVLDNGLDELDFTIGVETFKYRFSNTRRQVITVHIYRSHIRYLYDYIHHMLRSIVKKFLRKFVQ